jgi:hypothetical protein
MRHTCDLELGAPIPGAAGFDNHWRITGAAPGERVVVVAGHPGSTPVPGCAGEAELAVGAVVGSSIADASGVAEVSRTLPAWLAGAEFGSQAISRDRCESSATVFTTF